MGMYTTNNAKQHKIDEDYSMWHLFDGMVVTTSNI